MIKRFQNYIETSNWENTGSELLDLFTKWMAVVALIAGGYLIVSMLCRA